MLLLGDPDSAVGAPAPISTPSSAEVFALSLPSVAPWAHSGRWHVCSCPAPGPRPRDNDPGTAAPALRSPARPPPSTDPATKPKGPAHPPHHPQHREAQRQEDAAFPPISLLDGLSLQSQHLLAGISSGVAKLPRAAFSPAPTGFLACTQICPITIYLYLPEQPLISSPL